MKKIGKIIWLVMSFPFWLVWLVWLEFGVIVLKNRCPGCKHKRKRIEGKIDPSCYNATCSLYKYRDFSVPHDIYLR